MLAGGVLSAPALWCGHTRSHIGLSGIAHSQYCHPLLTKARSVCSLVHSYVERCDVQGFKESKPVPIGKLLPINAKVTYTQMNVHLLGMEKATAQDTCY